MSYYHSYQLKAIKNCKRNQTSLTQKLFKLSVTRSFEWQVTFEMQKFQAGQDDEEFKVTPLNS